MLCDAVVVGAGPSGSRVALGLASLGYNVLVLEKKAIPGEEVCCTGLVSQKCLELLGVPSSIVLRPANSTRILSPSGKVLRLWRDGAVAFVIDRPALDRVLADQAQAAGASYCFGTRVTGVRVEAEYVTIEAESRGEVKTYQCRALVLATGFGSSLPARLGLGRIKDFIVGAQAEVRVNTDEVEVYFSREIAPGSFAWLVPTREGSGLAGLMTRYQPGKWLNRLLLWLKSEGKITSTECQHRYGVIPLCPLKKTFTSRTLIVGEAAGQVKPLTGGGIYYGVLCADIVVEVLDRALRRGDLSEGALSLYQSRWQAELGTELRLGYQLHRLYRRLGNGQIEFLHSQAARYGVAQFVSDAESLPFDRHSKIVSGVLKHLVRSLLRHPAGLKRSSEAG